MYKLTKSYMILLTILACLITLVLCSKRKNARIGVEIHNRRILSKTLSNNGREIRRNQVQILDHLSTIPHPTYRINTNNILQTQFVASLYAKGSVNAPWLFVRDRVFNHTDSSLQSAFEKSVCNSDEYLSSIHDIVSQEIYGRQTFGYPRNMNDIVEAIPVLKSVPARSLMLGFRIMCNAEGQLTNSPVIRLRRMKTKEEKIAKLQSMLIQNEGIAMSGDTNTLPLSKTLLAKHNIFDLNAPTNGKTEQSSAKNTAELVSKLNQLLCTKYSTMNLGEVEITSDGSLLSVPLSTIVDSSGNSVDKGHISLGGGGVSVRLIFSNQHEADSEEDYEEDDDIKEPFPKYYSDEAIKEFNKVVKSSMSKRSQRKSPKILRKLKVKARVAMQKAMKKKQSRLERDGDKIKEESDEEEEKYDQLENANEVETAVEEIMEESLFFNLSPFVASDNMTPFDAEIAAGILAATIVDHIGNVYNDRIDNKSKLVKVSFRSDSKPLVRLFKSFLQPKKASIPASSVSVHDRFLGTLQSKLQSLISTSAIHFESQWIAGHPEKRIALQEKWTSEDWAVWQADWLSQLSLRSLLQLSNSRDENDSVVDSSFKQFKHEKIIGAIETMKMAQDSLREVLQKQADALARQSMTINLRDILN